MVSETGFFGSSPALHFCHCVWIQKSGFVLITFVIILELTLKVRSSRSGGHVVVVARAVAVAKVVAVMVLVVVVAM